MSKSENKKPETPPSPSEKTLPSSARTDQNDNEENAQKKPLPKANLRVETNNIGTPQPSQNTGSQRMHPAAASIMSNSATPITTTTTATNTTRHYSANTKNRPRKTEMPTDSRPERTQRPEDLRRAQYLANSSSHSNVPNITDEKDKSKQSKKNPATCWTTTSWILTWWAPPFMLRTFGKRIIIIDKPKPHLKFYII